MKLLAFCVYDAAVGAYLPPMFMRSKGEAIRSFVDACASSDSPFCKHGKDYTLFMVGAFDDSGENGILLEGCVPQAIMNAIEGFGIWQAMMEKKGS